MTGESDGSTVGEGAARRHVRSVDSHCEVTRGAWAVGGSSEVNPLVRTIRSLPIDHCGRKVRVGTGSELSDHLKFDEASL
jgi:hypothetical protein